MKKDGYYSSGKFAEMAHVTKKTLRYYNEQNILKPSFVDENGAGYYTDNDFARLQQIIFLKQLMFSLADIKELTVRNSDKDYWLESLKMQESLISEHIEQLRLMKESISEAREALTEGREVSWSEMLSLADANEMEQKLKQQYLNSSNISARIHLHSEYSENKEGWFPWLFSVSKIKSGEKILELGCGDGSFWITNAGRIPPDASVTLTDISDGIIRETSSELDSLNGDFNFRVMDAHNISFDDNSFDVIVANHMLFYCSDINLVLSEIKRTLKPGGRFLCSTYGKAHMREVTELVQKFDSRIALSSEKLYERFGRENGADVLSRYFTDIHWQQYEDSLCVTKPEPLVSYIMSCHGNQNHYITDHYRDFFAFVKKKTDKGFHITKDAGAFIAICEK